MLALLILLFLATIFTFFTIILYFLAIAPYIICLYALGQQTTVECSSRPTHVSFFHFRHMLGRRAWFASWHYMLIKLRASNFHYIYAIYCRCDFYKLSPAFRHNLRRRRRRRFKALHIFIIRFVIRWCFGYSHIRFHIYASFSGRAWHGLFGLALLLFWLIFILGVCLLSFSAS